MSDSKWVAFELHDGLLQWVLGARMQVAALLHSLDSHGETTSYGTPLQERLSLVLSYLNEASDEGRKLIQFIDEHPDEQVNLEVAIEAFCQRLTKHHDASAPRISFVPSERTWPQLGPRKGWAILRIAQQAIMNSVRHSQSTEIQVVLDWKDPDHLRATITDQGCGFDPNGTFPGHVGLSSMRQRAKLWKIQLQIDSQPGRGTRVEIVTPVRPTPE